MSDLKSNDIIQEFYRIVRNFSNSGISWGTNNYPANALSGWFGGTNAGHSVSTTTTAIKNGDNINTAQATAILLSLTRELARIRRTRIVITKTGSGVIYDGTAIAHLTGSRAASVAAPTKAGFTGGDDATLAGMKNYIARLKSNLETARNTTLRLDRTVCHTSCHSNCHKSRSRR